MKLFTTVAVLGLFISPLAYAQTPATTLPQALKATPAATAVSAEAEIFKAQLEGIIENQKAMSEKNGCKLLTTGDIKVEKASGYYAFTLPSITYVNAGGARSEIGMIAINAVPDADNVNWKVSLAIPTPIKRYGKDKVELVRTEIGSQSISGVWNTRLGRFTKLDGSFKNVRQNFLVEKTLVTIDDLAVTSLMTEQTAGTWSGPVDVAATNLTAYNSKMEYKDTWPKITLATTLSNTAAAAPLTKDDIAKRPQGAYSDYYNLISLFAGEPDRIRIAVTGFDAIVGRLQKSMLLAKQTVRSTYVGANLMMTGLNAIGHKDAKDPDIRNYDAVFKNGQVTVNDVPVSTVLGQ